MIVCSCNVLDDKAIRTAVKESAPRSAGQVYGCLGCSAQCGRCVRTIRKIMDEAIGLKPEPCPTDCGCCPAKTAAAKTAAAKAVAEIAATQADAA